MREKCEMVEEKNAMVLQKSGSKEGEAVIASFFNGNCISFNIANSSTFGHMIDESVEFAQRNPL